MGEEGYLVPDRQCGSCTVCCKELGIVDKDLSKLPGMLCMHCKAGKGCGIYRRRPSVCRTYHCLWRRLPNLNPDWRPDLSGVLIGPSERNSGPGAPFAVEIILVGSPEVLQGDKFAGLVSGFVEIGTVASLNIPTDAGMLARSMELNPILAPAIAARDLAWVKMLIWGCYEELAAAPTRPVDPVLMQNALDSQTFPA